MRKPEPCPRVTQQEIKSIIDKFEDIVRFRIDADPKTRQRSSAT
jgi:hypothetical protein